MARVRKLALSVFDAHMWESGMDERSLCVREWQRGVCSTTLTDIHTALAVSMSRGSKR